MPNPKLLLHGFLLLGSLLSAHANTAVEAIVRPDAWWDTTHQKFVERASQGEIDVLFLGDSITTYWEDPKRGKPVWDREFSHLRTANFGIPGDRTQYTLWRIRNGEAQGYQPKVVVLLIGTNNTGDRNTPAEAAAGVTAIVEELKTRFPATKILVLGLLPRDKKVSKSREQVEEINHSISKLADDRVTYLDIGDHFLNADGEIPVDVMPDLLHPNLKGYEIFAAAIKETLFGLISRD